MPQITQLAGWDSDSVSLDSKALTLTILFSTWNTPHKPLVSQLSGITRSNCDCQPLKRTERNPWQVPLKFLLMVNTYMHLLLTFPWKNRFSALLPRKVLITSGCLSSPSLTQTHRQSGIISDLLYL